MATTFNDRIALCPDCQAPLIGTLMISYAEWFCMECRWSGGILSAPRVQATEALWQRHAELNKRFEEHRPHIHCLSSGRLLNCPQCHEGEAHRHHLTEEEKKKQVSALEALGLQTGSNKPTS